jgi:uncharacterized OsmC-like protein
MNQSLGGTATERFALSLTLEAGYRFTVRFGDDALPELSVDELPPLGTASGPNPSRLLATAVGHCLGASLLHCLRRARIEVRDLQVDVTGSLVRNERGRLRIGELRVTLAPDVDRGERERMGRCLELFEDFCIVTESVRRGIPVSVAVATPAVVEAAG